MKIRVQKKFNEFLDYLKKKWLIKKDSVTKLNSRRLKVKTQLYYIIFIYSG